MAHRTRQRRNLAAPEPNSSSSMDSTLTMKHPKSTTFIASPSPQHPTPNLDLTQPRKSSSMVNHLARLDLNHKPRSSRKDSNHPHPHPHPHPPLVDTHLQAKAMTLSAIADSSKYSLLKPITHNARVILKQEKDAKAAKKPSKEKPRDQMSTSELQRWKLEGTTKNETKDSNGGLDRRSVFGEEKLEKSRNPVAAEHDIKRPTVTLALTSGRRRSFCGSHAELGDFFAINGVKVVSADMPPFMQIHAVDCARKTFDSMEKFTSKTLALTLKKEFDCVYGPAWHCIVGTSFGSFVTHSVGGFLYFSMDQKLYILLFKTTVQKAD
ncbi:hypothetical protein L6164_014639 [Bauhinia variegata]|uniref:Uncharacterized protein n=1 Tax=Bauhinia variegata TaxID=167791 RepID=A0ACB9NJ75_BAUVA|nr:hypothetical protein L6164_014639 [Bauhinia variegata]